MADKPQFADPSEIQASGNRMKTHMDRQTECFQRIVNTGDGLASSGMKSEAGRRVAAKLNEISNGAAMQRERSAEVVSNLQTYAARTSEEVDRTTSMAENVG